MDSYDQEKIINVLKILFWIAIAVILFPFILIIALAKNRSNEVKKNDLIFIYRNRF